MHELLQEIYILVSHVGYSGEYIESLPPAERKLILFYYKEEQKRKEKERQGQVAGGNVIGSPIDPTAEIDNK